MFPIYDLFQTTSLLLAVFLPHLLLELGQLPPKVGIS
jgi:hypothetical protein